MNQEIVRMAKYGAVGIVNTLVTMLAYYLLRQAGAEIALSNIVSYAAGVLTSFILNKCWTFKSKGRGWWREALCFGVGVLLCWLLQWVVFRLLLSVVAEAPAYLLGMVVYSLSNYVYNRLVTFR